MSKEKSYRQKVLSELLEVEKQLAELHSKQKKIEKIIQSLKDRLEHEGEKNQQPFTLGINNGENATVFSPDEKVTLFQNLFRGREDVYPKLWVNKKTGKNGYSPACSNEWIRGICEKPRVKCSDCSNQTFRPFTKVTVLTHLQGKHIVGVYPMLRDETCRC